MGARFSQRYHRFVIVAGLPALQMQLHAVLKRDAVIIEWKENDGVEAGGRPAVVNAHALSFW